MKLQSPPIRTERFIVQPLGRHQPAYQLSQLGYYLYMATVFLTYALLLALAFLALVRPPFEGGRVLAPWILIFATLFVGAVGFCIRSSIALRGKQVDDYEGHSDRSFLKPFARFFQFGILVFATILFLAVGTAAISLLAHQQPVSTGTVTVLFVLFIGVGAAFHNWRRS